MDEDLEELIQTDAGAEQLLHELRYEANDRACPYCGHDKRYNIKTRRFLSECANPKCKKQSSLTSGTYFHGKKLPIKTCFKLLLDVMSGREISASAHAKELDVSSTTVWRWRHEVRLIQHKVFPHGDIVKIDRQLLIKILFRRSVETPAIDAVEPSPSDCDEGIFEPRSTREAQSIAEANNFVSKNYKGVSEKYSQLYFAEFRFHQNAKIYPIRSLLSMIVRAGPVSIKDINNFSSPKFVDLPQSRN